MSYKIISDLIDKNKVPNFVLLYGTEEYYIDMAVKRAKDKYVDEAYESMNYIEAEKIENSFDDFYEFASTFPFMAEKKLCIVKEASFLTSTGSLGKKEEEKLLDMIEHNDSCTVFFLIKGGKPDLRKKAVKKIKESGGLFEINRLTEGELSKYIVSGFKTHNIEVRLQDADYLANNCGYLDYESVVSLYHVNNEIEKISSYNEGKKLLTQEDLELLMIKSVESNIFKLVDFICEGNKKKAYEILEEMLLNNTPEQFIIHMIARQYRLLYQYVVLSKKGYSFNDIMTKMKIKNFIATKLSKQTKGLSKEKIEEYMREILDIDKKIKTGEIDSLIGLELITNGIIK